MIITSGDILYIVRVIALIIYAYTWINTLNTLQHARNTLNALDMKYLTIDVTKQMSCDRAGHDSYPKRVQLGSRGDYN